MKELAVDFELADYNHKAANKVMLRRALPAWQRYALPVTILLILVLFFGEAVARHYGQPLSPFAFLGLLFVINAAFIFAVMAKRHFLWRSVAQSPLRQGPIRLATTVEGVMITTSTTQTSLRWQAILDVIPGPDGLLLRIGQVECFSLPSRAIPDKAAAAEALRFLNARIAEAKGTP